MHLLRAAAVLFFLSAAGCSQILPSPTPTLPPLVIRGRAVFDAYCSRCHGTVGETVVVGPSLAGVAARAGGRVPGQDAPTYLRNSVLSPNEYVVEGFAENVMPQDFRDQIPPDDLEAVISFLLTLE